ncbi:MULTISPECIES: autotransporter domain-containing esterase [unclassified Lysobacter]|uniref:autotransporter domain-containing esterase n=1 Tax=unclassified Lysobacter TaxID=2635362 RepID=UPI0006F45887|nr:MULTISPECIES: autotransporter domain-containing esterase [unclassified Lysobacter]KRA17894.1 esterase [Lysobacter sp. Root604]KRD34231.1 esterase [Lysobacter sp. Root916]KRD77576.1 esterase [Lysobacter sp. Root983]
MIKPVRTVLAAALALATAPAFAQTYSQTVFFGDSLTDSGHFRPALIQAVGPNGAQIGRFTTNPGLVWAEYLADYYGTNAVSDNQGGTNYAVGGARTGTNTAGALGPIPSLTTQVTGYLAANGGRADSRALYTVWGGANDLFAVAGGGSPTLIGAAVTSQIGLVGTLTNAGAKYILVPTIPDLGLTPQFRAGGAAQQAAGTQLSTTYNNALFGGLATAGYRVIPLDTFNLLREIVANPAPYGITNVTGTACNPQITASSVTCSPLNYVNPTAPDTYAFADGVHPSSRAHKILGDYAVSILEAPRQIALLPNSEAMVGRSRADRVANHLAGKPEGDGMRWWADARGDFQRYGKGDVYDGSGPSIAGGVDWTRGDWVFGGFAGFGKQSLDFGRNAGEFDQSDATLGGFAAWYGANAWVNGQLSWTKVDYDIDRRVVLGPTSRVHRGSTDGKNLTAAISAGWEFGDGALRHGPVIGFVAQRIDVDGFKESDPALATSLAYNDQSFDSLIGSAGWQVSYAINDHLKPYARLTYDREFEDADKEVFARLQSMPGTAPYAVPGHDFDQSYGTLLIGARTQLFGLDANLGSSVTVGQAGGNHATVFATIGAGF